jgi:hypothetical protein
MNTVFGKIDEVNTFTKPKLQPDTMLLILNESNEHAIAWAFVVPGPKADSMHTDSTLDICLSVEGDDGRPKGIDQGTDPYEERSSGDTKSCNLVDFRLLKDIKGGLEGACSKCSTDQVTGIVLSRFWVP